MFEDVFRRIRNARLEQSGCTNTGHGSGMFDDVFKLIRNDRPVRPGFFADVFRQIQSLESPIERLFYEALPTPRRSVQGFEVRLQYVEGPYRLDFAFLHPDGRKVCVECDGHDYHERTKEQAQRDRFRDRYLVKHGWQVMRFTGSELHRDARGCVDEVLELLGMQAR